MHNTDHGKILKKASFVKKVQMKEIFKDSKKKLDLKNKA